jgi:hypothetical protein
MFSFRTTLALLALALPLCSQTLQVQATGAGRAQKGSATIRLDSPPGKEPLALQWEIQVPVSIALDPRTIVAGEAATAAGKSVTCAILVNRSGDSTRCRCLLAGGAKPIGNGPVALMTYVPARIVRPGSYKLNLRSVFSVGEGTKKAPLKDAETTIIVSP